jgi:hypothetical protein
MSGYATNQGLVKANRENTISMENATIQVQIEGHNFSIGEVTDSQSTVLYRGPITKQEELPEELKEAISLKSACWLVPPSSSHRAGTP